MKKYFNLGAEGGQFLDFMSLIGNQYDFQQVEVSTDDGFIIIYTAAISGNPRGALLSHSNIICANMNFVYLLKLTPQDVHLNVLPFFHLGGLITTTAGFHAGSMTVNMKKFDASNAVRLINEKRVSIITEFSPILSSILEYQENWNRYQISKGRRWFG